MVYFSPPIRRNQSAGPNDREYGDEYNHSFFTSSDRVSEVRRGRVADKSVPVVSCAPAIHPPSSGVKISANFIPKCRTDFAVMSAKRMRGEGREGLTCSKCHHTVVTLSPCTKEREEEEEIDSIDCAASSQEPASERASD